MLRPQLKSEGVAKLKQTLESGARVVLVSRGLGPLLMIPLAAHLGVHHLLANRLEFRDGVVSGACSIP